MAELTEQQRNQIRTDLARAMNYQAKRVRGIPSGFVGWFAPDGCRQHGGHIYESEEQAFIECAPNPFTSAADSRALVKWLACAHPLSARDYWARFIAHLDFDNSRPVMFAKELMTAPLPVIALAAHRALGLEVKEDA